MRRFLINRAQLWRLTLWIENQHQRTIFSLTTRFRRCSTTPDSETLKMPLSADFGIYGKEIDEKQRAKKHETVRKISRDVEILSCLSRAPGGLCDVYLVGTVHISQKSCTEVQEIIKFLKPEIVFLELCESRKGILMAKTLKMPTVEEMVANIRRQPNLFGVFLNLLYAALSEKLKFIPGSEFRVAYEEAIKYGGRVALGDRPMKITLERAWRKMSLWQKIKFFLFPRSKSSLGLIELLEKMEFDNDDTIASFIQEMSEEFPSLMETFVHERDQYMSYTLLKVARKSSSVVAVVGKGHLQGIKKHWLRPILLKDLMTIPSKKAATSGVSRTSILVVGLTIISNIYLLSKM